jgi:deltex-like protein
MTEEAAMTIRSGFSVQVTAPTSTKHTEEVDPAHLTNWRNVPIAEMNEIAETERRNGHLRSDEFEKCAVCMCEFEPADDGQIVHLANCRDHFFHQDCIKAALIGAALKCPVCGVTYGDLEGTMPSGSMAMELVPSLQCDSYPPGTWVLTYQFNSGVQDGISYSGNSRNAVLPNTKEGREILRLFIRAFYRRHIFKIGDSITNGTTDTVVWAGIHHKSNVSGGPAQFGFPDPTYFSRVKEELAARGVS